jgi:hypothetical protein
MGNRMVSHELLRRLAVAAGAQRIHLYGHGLPPVCLVAIPYVRKAVLSRKMCSTGMEKFRGKDVAVVATT